MAFSSGLSRAEAERLACLAEEMGEAIQAIGKVLRHGYDSYNPSVGPIPTNRDTLEKELGDVRHWMIAMCEAGDLSKESIHAHADRKAETVRGFLHFQGTRRR